MHNSTRRKRENKLYIGSSRGADFLRAKGILQADEVFIRSSLVDLLLEHDLRVMNTFFQKAPREKATFKLV
eukprot:13255370-Heterocapsa_arctica.AAC.1